jgi:hypothetical protein
MINLFDHLAFIFLCGPILLIEMVIMHRWRFTNCCFSICNIKTSRKRWHIWIIILWQIKIKHAEIRSLWHKYWWSMWRKQHWCRKSILLQFLIMELFTMIRFRMFRIFRTNTIIDILLSLRLSRKLLIKLRHFFLTLATAFGFNCFPNTYFKF